MMANAAASSEAGLAPPPNPVRTQFFQELKPPCTRITLLAMKPPQDGTHGARELAVEMKRLLAVLGSASNQTLLDEKLADYVFFPLTHALRNIERYPLPLAESIVLCTEILIRFGWKGRISSQLVQQLLMLLTFILDGTPAKVTGDGKESNFNKGTQVPEETSIAVFGTLATLLNTAGTSAEGSRGLVEKSVMPSLGHSLSVMLDGVTDGRSPEVQLAALRAVDAVFGSVKDHAALATILPGVVSALTKVLSAPGHYKRRVLAACLISLREILVAVLADIRLRHVTRTVTRVIMDEQETGKDKSENENKNKNKYNVLGPAWVQATSFQIRLALSTILKLRSSPKEEIQRPLERLCIKLLDECHTTLQNCIPLLVETAIILVRPQEEEEMEENDGAFHFSPETTLENLVGIYPELTEVVKKTVYDWMISLPRVMQSSDDAIKMQALQHLSKGFRTLSDLHIESATLRNLATSALRDSVVALMAGSGTSRMLDVMPSDASLPENAQSLELSHSPAEGGKDFSPVILSHGSQARTRQELIKLLAYLGTPLQQARLASELFESTRESTGNEQISSFWLSYQLLREALSQRSELDDLLNLPAVVSPGPDVEAVFDNLFTFSVSVIDSHTETGGETDWRLEAIALEVTSFAASRRGKSFRPELIDVLYPIATLLGSSSAQIRHHAIVGLNSIAASCGYGNVSELIVDNVDYMVNSVALRLNTLDITPASTQVLTMMVRLAGPRLVPFLDDVVASIFSALESYHGYAVFVENLFGVLKEIAEQGVKSDALLLEHTEARAQDHRKQPAKQRTLDDVLETLGKRQERIRQRQEEEEHPLADEDSETKHPKKPWSSLGEQEEKEDDGPGKGDYDSRDPNEEEEKPMSPTYQLLLKIADLTQHYLTSPTPTLRKSLLDLLGIVAPALGSDEDRFLPLIHVIWPVVISRLYDDEPYIAVAACDAIHMLCSAAGDFLSSRITAEWDDKLGRWCRDVKTRGSRSQAQRSRGANLIIYDPAEGDRRSIRIPGRTDTQTSLSTSMQLAESQRGNGGGGLGRFAQSARVWDGVIRLLTGIVMYVRIGDDIFDDILDLVEDVMMTNAEVRGALEAVNPDAVWYAMYQRGLVEWSPAPVLDGVSFPEMEMICTGAGGGKEKLEKACRQ